MGLIGNRFNGKSAGRALRPGAIALTFLLVGCTISEDQRGNLPDPDKLAEVKPGTTTKEQVVKILGSPSSSGTFDDDTWYYISRKTKQVAFFAPEVLDQQVFIIDFTDQGIVKDVGHRTLANAEPITPAPGATPAPGRELSFMEQLIGNIGRFGGGGSSAPTPGVSAGPSNNPAGQ